MSNSLCKRETAINEGIRKVKIETKYDFGDKTIIPVDCFDDSHKYTHTEAFEAEIDMVRMEKDKEPVYRVSYDGRESGSRWINESDFYEQPAEESEK